MNAVAVLAAARKAGADFRLNAQGDDIQAAHWDVLPPALALSIAAQRSSVMDALAAETVLDSGLPWRRQGPGWLAIIDPSRDGDGARLHLMRTKGRWAFTSRPCPTCSLVLIVAQGTLAECLACAVAEARRLTEIVVAS